MPASKKVAICQSNYIPWKGYFDNINAVDVFVIYDDVQYTKNDWRNRNKIKTSTGTKWLTIPVTSNFGQAINEAQISDPDWNLKHWRTLELNYSKAANFTKHRDFVEGLYSGCKSKYLSEINYRFLTAINDFLGIKTQLRWSTEFKSRGNPTERLVGICQELGATHYYSGPAARDYLEEHKFAEAGIELKYSDYSGYPEYRQLHPPFDHAVSILDLIFNEGSEAPRYMKSFSESKQDG